MVGQCLQLCVTGISAVFDFMALIFDYLGAWTYIIGAFMIYTVYRVLLVPVIGAGQSDMARKVVKGGHNNSSGKSDKSKKGD